ncbi:NACHT domain-containing protein 3 [Elsinoe fawcettii]|nr:NACHT domain-containing protein 3 [Elsinoe fawcettii]
MSGALDPSVFTIGWISALAIEYEAACLSLDEDLGRPDFLETRNDNVYTIGRVGQHHIVLTFLPEGTTGTNAAAVVARDMVHAFPNIKLGLMVGIGGGAPRYPEVDIRLGDVVVGIPNDGHGGVIQYDFGKLIHGQKEYRRTGHLDQPPAALRAAVTQLQRDYNRKPHTIRKDIERRLADVRPRLRRECGPQDPATDHLFVSDYDHGNDDRFPDKRNACSGVNTSVTVLRRVRNAHEEEDDDDPAIHFGTIASGNTLIKDAQFRDEFAQRENVLCFEMEAAGLMNHFPCLVIRGICDYADSHKNKNWQGYASMTAAAYATDLIKTLKMRDLDGMSAVRDVLESLQRGMAQIQASTPIISAALNDVQAVESKKAIRAWLRPPDTGIEFDAAIHKRQKGTCEWIFADARFRNWRSRSNGILLLQGESGCGKTVMCAHMIERLQEQDPSRITIFFFFTLNDEVKRTVQGMLTALIYQLSLRSVIGMNHLLHLFHSSDKTRRPTTPVLISLFKKMLSSDHVSIILDAIDESSEQLEIMATLKVVLETTDFQVKSLVTGRPRETIKAEVLEWVTYGQVSYLDIADIKNDINSFVFTTLEKRFAGRGGRWERDPTVVKMILQSVMAKTGHS